MKCYRTMQDFRSVALHTEGVDRNLDVLAGKQFELPVALHTEGVDRNFSELRGGTGRFKSPSAWKVWVKVLF